MDDIKILNDINVDLDSNSPKLIIGRWMIDLVEPQRKPFLRKFPLKIQKDVKLSLSNLVAKDFQIPNYGDFLSISLNTETWSYGIVKKLSIENFQTTFQIELNPKAISDCKHEQNDDNKYPVSFNIVLQDGETSDEIANVPVHFNIKLAKKVNLPSVKLDISKPEIMFHDGLRDEEIGSVVISNTSKLLFSPKINGMVELNVVDKDDNKPVDSNIIYLDSANDDERISNLESGQIKKYKIKANFPMIGNPVERKRFGITASFIPDNNSVELPNDSKELIIDSNTARPRLIVRLMVGDKSIYVTNCEKYDAETTFGVNAIKFSNETQLERSCFSFSLGNGSENGIKEIGVVIKDVKCTPSINEDSTEVILRDGESLNDVLGFVDDHRPVLLQSLATHTYPISFWQDKIEELYTHQDAGTRNYTSEVAFKIEFDYWEEDRELTMRALPQESRKHFCFELTIKLHQCPSVKWLGIDYGTSAIVCRFDNYTLPLRNRKLNLFRQQTDEYEQDTQYLSSNVIYRNNRVNIIDQSSLICDYDSTNLDNPAPDYNSLALTLSPTSTVEDANQNFMLPCMKMLMGYDNIPNIQQYDGFSYSFMSESGKITTQNIFTTEGNRRIPSRLCKVSNVMQEIYRELFLYFIKPEIQNIRLDNIVLTVPNTFSPNHFKQLRDIVAESFNQYYIRNLKFISESDAVACYYAKNWADVNHAVNRSADSMEELRRCESVLVYDMGAGTLDITYLLKCEGEIHIKGRMGIAKAGNYLDGLLASIIAAIGEENSLPNICLPNNITSSDRLLLARKLKNIIKNQLKPQLGMAGAQIRIEEDKFRDIGLDRDITIERDEVVTHADFREYLRSCTKDILDNFFRFYRLYNEHDKVSIDTVIISGRASKLSLIRDELTSFLEITKSNDDFKIVDMSSVIGRDISKDVVVEGAMAFASGQNLTVEYDNIMANYGVIYYDKVGELKYTKLLDPREQEPIQTTKVEGMRVNEYVTEEIICDISGCDQQRPLILVQSYSMDTLNDWRNGSHEYITVMSELYNLQEPEDSRLKITVDNMNKMRLIINGASTRTLAPSHIDVNSELNKKSMWPVMHNENNN